MTLCFIDTTDCHTIGAVQLVDGDADNEGRLEYCNNGVWSPFCNLHTKDAVVACKQLGYAPYASMGSLVKLGSLLVP